MSITVTSPGTFVADLTGAPSDLGINVQCGIRQIPQGTMISPLSSDGITETDLGGGVSNYEAVREAPVQLSQPDADGPRYQIIWTVNGEEQDPEDLHVVASLPVSSDVSYTPTAQDVADLLFARTKTAGNRYLGEFTAETTPTLARVERLIIAARDHIQAKVGVIENVELQEDAKTTTAIYTAMLIELSAEKMNQPRFDELKKMYNAAIDALIEAVQAEGKSAVDDQVTGPGSESQPSYNFDGYAIGNNPW